MFYSVKQTNSTEESGENRYYQKSMKVTKTIVSLTTPHNQSLNVLQGVNPKKSTKRILT